MNIAVVDDEEIIRQQIRGFIEKQKPEFYISDFATGEEPLAAKADFDIKSGNTFVKRSSISGSTLDIQI